MGRFGDSVAGLRAFMAERGYKALCLRSGKEVSGNEVAHDTAFLPN
jgi:hypothetical protein